MTGVMNCSVALSLNITKPLNMIETDYFSDKDIKNIIESLSKIIDLNLYDIKKSSKEIILSIKEDVFNENIQDLIIEIYKKTDLKVEYLYLSQYLKYNSPKDEWSISLDKDSKNVVNMKRPDIGLGRKECYKEGENLAYLLSRDCKDWNNYRLCMTPFRIFSISGELNEVQVCLLNWFKRDYFNNSLNGSLVFH